MSETMNMFIWKRKKIQNDSTCGGNEHWLMIEYAPPLK